MEYKMKNKINDEEKRIRNFRMTNLEKAKELRGGCKKHIYNVTSAYACGQHICPDCKQEAKQLKEKVEKGCGKEYCPSCNEYKYDEYSFKCGRWELLTLINRPKERDLCQKCKETLKILKEILE